MADRSWFRFTCRASLLASVLVAVVMGRPHGPVQTPLHRAAGQRQAVKGLRQFGAIVEYDFYDVPRGAPPGPAWVRRWLGVDFYSDVTGVYISRPDILGGVMFRSGRNFNYAATRQPTDADWRHVTSLQRLRTLHLSGIRPPTHVIRELARKPHFQNLTITDVRLTDQDLREFQAFIWLKALNFVQTDVSQADVKWLQRKLPKCRIDRGHFSDEFRVSPPKSNPWDGFKVTRRTFDGGGVAASMATADHWGERFVPGCDRSRSPAGDHRREILRTGHGNRDDAV